MNRFWQWYMSKNLVPLILVGLAAGIAFAALGLLSPWVHATAITMGMLGNFFISALKAVAPILVFVLVMNAIASHRSGQEVYIKPIPESVTPLVKPCLLGPRWTFASLAG